MWTSLGVVRTMGPGEVRLILGVGSLVWFVLP